MKSLIAILIACLIAYLALQKYRAFRAGMFDCSEDPEYMEEFEPREEEEPEPEEPWKVELTPDHSYSESISPLVPMIVSKRRYESIQEDIEAYKSYATALCSRLAKSEGNYYLQDSKSMSAKYQTLALENSDNKANAAYWERMYHQLEVQYDALFKQLRGAGNKGEFIKNSGSGKFESDDGADAKEKQQKAYWMYLSGSSKSEIADSIGISAGSASVYITKGRQLLEGKDVCIVNSEGRAWKCQALDIDDEGYSQSHPEYWIDPNREPNIACYFEGIMDRSA